MSPNPASLALVAALVLAAPAAAQTAFEPLAAPIRAQALVLPAETSVVALTPADPAHPRQTYTIRRTFGADGSITAVWRSATAESTQVWRPDGTLVSARQSDATKKASLEATVAPGRASIRTVIKVNGQVKSDKTTALKPAIVLRDEVQLLILQAWNQGVRDGLKFQSLSPDGGMVGDFSIVFRPVADVTTLSDKYTYPAEFRDALEAGDYVVADMSLGGIAAVFYPHHFYLVYTRGPTGLEWAGYFGEDPKAPAFQYRR